MKWNFCTKLQLPPKPLTRGATVPRSPFSLSSVLNWICWTPPRPEKTFLGTTLHSTTGATPGNVVNINIKTSNESFALASEDTPLRTLPPSETGTQNRRHKPLAVSAKPSQAKPQCWLGEETCASRNSMSPCLLAIPAFDRIAGLNNRFLNYNRGICLR